MNNNKKHVRKRKFSIKERFLYWFDNRMSKGSLGLIRFLIAGSIVLASLMACLIILFGFNEEGEYASVFWDSISTVINAWMPSFEDGSPGYVVMMSFVAIGGVLFTSVLIGIITSAIEEKIYSLKRGNSLVLEEGHTVVLGFYPGEYTLLNQLILAAAGEPSCVVLAEDMEREEMEQDISENLDVPKNFRIVCRTADITDPTAIKKCSVETCRTVIVSPTDDLRTIKAVLAVSALLQEKGVQGIGVNAIISKSEYRFPPSLADANNIATLPTNSILAKIIAHSCTQTGLSESFREVFNFEGSEFYMVDLKGIGGMTFAELMDRLDQGTPAGVLRDGNIVLNPPEDYQFQEGDQVLVFSEEKDSAKLGPPRTAEAPVITAVTGEREEETNTIILGHNETLPTILRNLPLNVSHVCLAGTDASEKEQDLFRRIAEKRNLTLDYYQGDLHSEKVLLELAMKARHMVVLSDHEAASEEADMESIFLLMNLRDIRKRFGLHFNITVEMQKEQNHNLVGFGDHTDFLVSSSMSSLILAQLAESRELIDVFAELLSNEGQELHLNNVGRMHLTGTFTVRDLRHIMLKQRFILLGHLDAEKRSRYDLRLDEKLTLTPDDCLIVLGEE